ncbi:hypothetical protein C8R45DRAFT_1182070 [Mycena sanguinolenta]|nr:hypothetical protein C8R45DRAFT_1182070 [Mycena sanguinolenta]
MVLMWFTVLGFLIRDIRKPVNRARIRSAALSTGPTALEEVSTVAILVSPSPHLAPAPAAVAAAAAAPLPAAAGLAAPEPAERKLSIVKKLMLFTTIPTVALALHLLANHTIFKVVQGRALFAEALKAHDAEANALTEDAADAPSPAAYSRFCASPLWSTFVCATS